MNIPSIQHRIGRISPFFRGLLFNLLIVAVVISVSQVVSAAGPGETPPPAPTGTVNPTPAQQATDPVSNPNSSAFKLVVCDGPRLPSTVHAPDGYIPCDFNAMMVLARHLINIMMVLGVLAAIVLFSYAGSLYISGNKSKIDKAHSIFPKIFVGFIIMLSAWFVVYQILIWLTKGNTFTTLLGTPS